MKKYMAFFLTIIVLLNGGQHLIAQQPPTISMDSTLLPYAQIPDYPADHSAPHVLARMIDGLGYRYYWATEGIRPEDLAFEPGNDGASFEKVVQHLFGLSDVMANAIQRLPNDRSIPLPELSFEEYRKQTLENLKKASDLLRNNDQLRLEDCTLIFKRKDRESESAFWHLINGPLTDAIYHTGQIVSYRRSAGNPISPLVNVFMGRNREPKSD